MKLPFRSVARRAGFTLLEMVIAITIMAILAAAAIPVTTSVLTFRMKKATREELSALCQAAGDYFRDTLQFPSSVVDLLVDPNHPAAIGGVSGPFVARAVAGWSGPYLPGESVDPISKENDYLVDAWSRDYKLSVVADVLTIASAGEDAVFGNEDDLAIECSVTWIRRELTLERLRVINQAIVLYNGQFQLTNPLPANYSSIYTTLVAHGLLPSSNDFQKDAWGDPFVEDPAATVPVVRVKSNHVSS